MIRLASTLLLAVAATLAAPPRQAAAQPAAPAARAPLTEQVKREVVDTVARLFERMYADADTGRLIAERVRSRLGAGAYQAAADWQHFTRALTQDLQSVNGDTHLWVELAAPVPGGPGAGGPPPQQHGVERVERLDGNVGYLRMSGFGGGEGALRAVEAGLRYLASTDAVILDLRNSRGGSGALANFIISHFTGPDTVHSLTVYDRARDVTTHRYTMATVPGPRRPDVPLWILTDDVTRSAAEDVPFVLQNMRRATIVGGRTAGAGRNNAGVPLGHGLVASISFTRVMDPRTRREWEQVGVRPDVPVAARTALAVAHRLALDTLVARAANPARRQELALVREAVAAAERPAAAGAAALAQWVGTYEGGQFVTVEEGRLVYQPRVAQPRVPLVPLGERTFAGGAVRYAFEPGAGGAAALRITMPDGASTRYARTARTVPRRPE